jgi:alkaline phosphatase D
MLAIMRNFLTFFCCVATIKFAIASNANTDKLASIVNLRRLAFGSCNKQFLIQPLWKEIFKQSPDLFLWAGDNIYANTQDEKKISEAYRIQNEVDDYRFFKTFTPVIGTWDDHDFGDNGEDGNYRLKRLSQGYFLDFVDEPLMSPRRLQEGIYTSYLFGQDEQKIKVILLDNRYFKNLEKNDNRLLGSTQWAWLEKEIENSEASLHLIVSGLSIISPGNPSSEEWRDFPKEKARLKRILQAKKIPYLYVTGDKHFSSIFWNHGELEFLSSGMTHNTKPALRPWVRMKYPDPVFQNNFGLIDFSWEGNNPVLTLTIETVQRSISKRVKWNRNTWIEI